MAPAVTIRAKAPTRPLGAPSPDGEGGPPRPCGVLTPTESPAASEQSEVEAAFGQARVKALGLKPGIGVPESGGRRRAAGPGEAGVGRGRERSWATQAHSRWEGWVLVPHAPGCRCGSLPGLLSVSIMEADCPVTRGSTKLESPDKGVLCAVGPAVGGSDGGRGPHAVIAAVASPEVTNEELRPGKSSWLCGAPGVLSRSGPF